jgi:hypothetical protein
LIDFAFFNKSSPETENKNHKAVELLKQLVKELEKYKNSVLTLSESFDLQFIEH